MPVVTISASYGSGGSEVAPALAERLGVRFVDRVVSPETAHRLAEAENAGLFWRLIRSISPAGATSLPPEPYDAEIVTTGMGGS